jgi:hypothetical protein
MKYHALFHYKIFQNWHLIRNIRKSATKIGSSFAGETTFPRSLCESAPKSAQKDLTFHLFTKNAHAQCPSAFHWTTELALPHD